MQNVNEHLSKVESPPEKELELLMPVEFDEDEPIGNMYKERLADPVRGSMDYTRYCILAGQGMNKDAQVARKECRKADLLAYAYRQYEKTDPEGFKRGLPGKDLMMFMSWPLECRTCILYRYAPGSPENVRRGEIDRAALRNRTIWGLAGGAMALVWTVALGNNFLELDRSLTALIGVSLAALIVLVVRGRGPARSSTDAHGPGGHSSFLGRLRSRVKRSPSDHGSIRYREVEDGTPYPPSAPAGASTEGTAEPPAMATEPSEENGGSTSAPESNEVGQVPAEALVTATNAEPNASVDLPVNQAEPREEPVTSPVEGSEPKNPEKPPKPSRQPSKKAPAKGKAKSVPAKGPEAKEARTSATEGFPCTHPGCGRILMNEAARKSHERSHGKVIEPKVQSAKS
jgi:hypothetical protein